MSKGLARALDEDVLCPVVFPVTRDTETELLTVIRRQAVVTVEVGMSAQVEVRGPVQSRGAGQHPRDCQEDSDSGKEQKEDCGVRDGVTVIQVVRGACQVDWMSAQEEMFD
jgi:hypothetical protein